MPFLKAALTSKELKNIKEIEKEIIRREELKYL